MENRKLKIMTLSQIFIIIYLCCFVCSMGGLWIIDFDTAKALRKMGHKKIYSVAPFDLYSVLLCLCPILNALVAIIIICNYDTIVKNAVTILTKGEEANE